MSHQRLSSANTLYGSYLASRIYLHNPPGEGSTSFRGQPHATEALTREEIHLLEDDPEVNQYVCIAVLMVSIGIMAATAEWVS
jgi:Ca2+:H+ antiporter